MKMPAILSKRRDELATAKKNLEAAEARLTELEALRLSALESEGVEAALRIEKDIADEGASIRAYRDRLAILERKAKEEERAEAERQYQKAVASLPALLEPLNEIDAEIEAAVRSVAGVLDRRDMAKEKILASWPAPVERPWGSLISSDAACRRLFKAFELCAPNSRWASKKLERITQAIEGFADGERRDRAAFVEGLKTRNVPEPETEESAA